MKWQVKTYPSYWCKDYYTRNDGQRHFDFDYSQYNPHTDDDFWCQKFTGGPETIFPPYYMIGTDENGKTSQEFLQFIMEVGSRDMTSYSSIWGYLSKTNKRYYNDVELDANPDITMDDDENNDKADYLFLNVKDNINETKDYLLLNKKQPYTKNYRLKPFITSLQRIVIAEICIQIGINKVVRINTDNITFDKDLLTDDDIKAIKKISPTFIPEDKTTGKFYILLTNNFVPVE